MGLGKVFPRPTIANHAHLAHADTESGREFAKQNTLRAKFSHGANVSLGQHLRSFFATCAATSPLAAPIGVVVALGAKEQVLRVHASPVVAAVKHTLSCCNGADVKLVAQPVSEQRGLIPEPHLPVAGPGDGSLPLPATGFAVGSLDLPNEPASEPFVMDNGHVNLLSRLAVPSAVRAARGLFVPSSITGFVESMGFSPTSDMAHKEVS